MRPPWPLVVPASPSLPLSCLARPWRLFASAPPPGMLVRSRSRLARWPPAAAAAAAAAAARASAARPPPCRAHRGPPPRTRPPTLRVVATSGRPVRSYPGHCWRVARWIWPCCCVCNVRLRGCPPGRSVSLVCVPLQAKLLAVSCNVCGSQSARARRCESCRSLPPRPPFNVECVHRQ